MITGSTGQGIKAPSMLMRTGLTRPRPGAPPIVVLHGCKQKEVTFARDAGLAIADRSRLALMLPEQKGLPSYLHDVFLFPWAVGCQQPERLFQLVRIEGRRCRSGR